MPARRKHKQAVNHEIPAVIRIRQEKPQAPSGKYLARVIHVETNWTYLGNRKAALYLEVTEGPEEGTQARLFYNLSYSDNGEIEIGPKSKLARDMEKLFPDEIADGVVDLSLFKDKVFQVTMERVKAKDGEINAIVTNIEHPDVGW